MSRAGGRIDVVSIFPQYLAPLDLSLIGKARAEGRVRIDVHDLRQWTTDAHRTVDDTPAGGGAGMVMRPDIWGRAIDELLDGEATIVIPSPAGEPLTQALAQELSEELTAGRQLLIPCGRYEGIDARVGEYYASSSRARVREVSIGDYVLGGGEVAALVMIEALTRLLPGVIGNPDSLVEESHGQAALLEYPVYTAPPQWRGLEVPEVLRSGDHGRIAGWRREQAVRRTAERRPDLLRGHEVQIHLAKASDAAALAQVAQRTFHLACPPDFPAAAAQRFVAENLSREQFRRWIKSRRHQVWVARLAGVIIGYTVLILGEPGPGGDRPENTSQARAPVADVNKMYVLPEHHGSGIAQQLLRATMSGAVRAGMRRLWLGVNQRNTRAQAFYRRHGFTITGERTFTVGGRTEADYVMERTIDDANQISAADAHMAD